MADISTINFNNTSYNLKDAQARAALDTYLPVTAGGSITTDTLDTMTNGIALVQTTSSLNTSLYNALGSTYAYVIQFFYNTIGADKNRMQVAFPYTTTSVKMAWRVYYTDSWSDWHIIQNDLYFQNQAVSVATSAQIMRIPATGMNSAITTDTIVLNCTFDDSDAVTSKVSWTSYDGYIVFTGTCIKATTANVTLGRKGN